MSSNFTGRCCHKCYDSKLQHKLCGLMSRYNDTQPTASCSIGQTSFWSLQLSLLADTELRSHPSVYIQAVLSFYNSSSSGSHQPYHTDSAVPLSDLLNHTRNSSVQVPCNLFRRWAGGAGVHSCVHGEIGGDLVISERVHACVCGGTSALARVCHDHW